MTPVPLRLHAVKVHRALQNEERRTDDEAQPIEVRRVGRFCE